MTHAPKTSTPKAAKRSTRNLSPPRSGRPARRPGKGTRRGGAPLAAGSSAKSRGLQPARSSTLFAKRDFREHIDGIIRSHVRAAREVDFVGFRQWLRETLEVQSEGANGFREALFRIHLALEHLQMSPVAVSQVLLCYGASPSKHSICRVAQELLAEFGIENAEAKHYEEAI